MIWLPLITRGGVNFSIGNLERVKIAVSFIPNRFKLSLTLTPLWPQPAFGTHFWAKSRNQSLDKSLVVWSCYLPFSLSLSLVKWIVCHFSTFDFLVQLLTTVQLLFVNLYNARIMSFCCCAYDIDSIRTKRHFFFFSLHIYIYTHMR